MTITATEKAQLDELAELDSRPTAPARVVRSAGQGGFAYVVLDAAEAFGWFGAQNWTPDQTKAGMALAFGTIALVQNLGPKAWGALLGWWKARRTQQ